MWDLGKCYNYYKKSVMSTLNLLQQFQGRELRMYLKKLRCLNCMRRLNCPNNLHYLYYFRELLLHSLHYFHYVLNHWHYCHWPDNQKYFVYHLLCLNLLHCFLYLHYHPICLLLSVKKIVYNISAWNNFYAKVNKNS